MLRKSSTRVAKSARAALGVSVPSSTFPAGKGTRIVAPRVGLLGRARAWLSRSADSSAPSPCGPHHEWRFRCRPETASWPTVAGAAGADSVMTRAGCCDQPCCRSRLLWPSLAALHFHSGFANQTVVPVGCQSTGTPRLKLSRCVTFTNTTKPLSVSVRASASPHGPAPTMATSTT